MVSSMAVSLIHSKELDQANIFNAIRNGNTSAVKAWLKSTADYSIRNEKGQTALDVAVQCNNKSIVYQLVKSGVAVTSEVNALKAKNVCKGRAFKFFIAGWVFTPFLWIGSFFAIDNMSKINFVATA